MSEIISVILMICIIGLALKLVLKVTGCLVRVIVFIVAFYLILTVLRIGFNITLLPFLPLGNFI